MCIDSTTSMKTFLIGSISGLLLFNFSDYKYISLHIIAVSFMQLAEYMMWIDINCKNNYNKIGNIIGILSLLGQISSDSIFKRSFTNNDLLNIIVYLYIIWRYVTAKLPCSIENFKGHLKWGFLQIFNKTEMIVLLVHYMYNISGYIRPRMYDNISSGIYALLLIYSINMTGMYIYNVSHWGSLWCWLSNILGPILLAKVGLSKLFNKH